MKLQFKNQEYQIKAVANIVDVFKGQAYKNNSQYRLDSNEEKDDLFNFGVLGYRNHRLSLSPEQLLANINDIQKVNNLKISPKLHNYLGACELDIDMETGTGKTYVYIKTMFELNKVYGWNKFIVVVPFVAIREGVYKSFKILEEHFYKQYQKKASVFVYDSKKLASNYSKILDFAKGSDQDINVIIINIQSFNKFNDGNQKNKNVTTTKPKKNTTNIMYEERDDFFSFRPIDLIKGNNPIVIIDEPQNTKSDKSIQSILNLNPLFTLNFSATHAVAHNKIYMLDPLDAYKQNLVKRIEVKGFSFKNLSGTSNYLYLEEIKISNKAPEALISLDIQTAKGEVKRITKLFKHGDDLYQESNLDQYKGFVINLIDAFNSKITFLNGVELSVGESLSNLDKEELQRLQLRETIRSHLQKEESLFAHGIKCLSLFFIDEVANYKDYHTNDNGFDPAFLWTTFEEEYKNEVALVLQDKSSNKDYVEYLKKIDVKATHLGYFSRDKDGKDVNCSKKEDEISNVNAYDLILKDKEKLMSFETDVRFIFSHSALKEGWDNPNVFQICTLRNSKSSDKKRQEIGRGLRICVNKEGIRQDTDEISDIDLFHRLNTLTVIANESYKDFVTSLQEESLECLHERVFAINVEYFENKVLLDKEGNEHTLSKEDAKKIVSFLKDNACIDANGYIKDSCKKDIEKEKLAIPIEYKDVETSLLLLLKASYDKEASSSIQDDICKDARKTKISKNTFQDIANTKEFLELWDRINHKYFYTVNYSTKDLIDASIKSINDNLTVNTNTLVLVEEGVQSDFSEFKNSVSRYYNYSITNENASLVDYIEKIAKDSNITRKTVIDILKGIDKDKYKLFAKNPQNFVCNVSHLIKSEKASLIIKNISYSFLDDKYSMDIFIESNIGEYQQDCESYKKHATRFLMLDSNIEKDFADALDISEEICAFVKLPKSFYIPTPIGKYSPDWAIVAKKNDKKHIYLIAETKGSLDDNELRFYEKNKILCAKRLYKQLHKEELGDIKPVQYEKVSKTVELFERIN